MVGIKLSSELKINKIFRPNNFGRARKQFRLVAARGCREGQGYLFSRPLEAAAFESLLAGRTGLAPLARAG